ncbi:MAG: type I restriction endonuclease subunit R [Tissierellales bacterium]|nr:type I restriction endonuclease subunit R [Tissierellales bacterium]
MPIDHREIKFEEAIEWYLINHDGFVKGNKETFDPERGLDPTVLIPFIKRTQPDKWKYLENIQKEKAEGSLLDDLCKALDSKYEGCLKVIRHGFKCYGKEFKVAFFAPASGLNPDTKKLYDENVLTVTRQLRYSNKHHNEIDVVLSLNGIPLVTMELKNPMSGQNWRHAVHQYQTDRDPNDLIFQFKKRALVHFAVDPDEAYMTTRLKGSSTYFLPFNKGRNIGAGNPDNPLGYKTSYVWEEVLSRDSFMDIFARFIHLEVIEVQIGGKTVQKETMIFPRYHQIDAVRRLIYDASTSGVGVNYLIQHSTGSGKSNTIAWLAHRLTSLHNENDEKVFDSIVVITDRLILDQQLQNTIYQFEHKEGVIAKIDKDSTQLSEALDSATPIVITTLQKFQFVTEKIGELPNRRYAVIIDEAHSSQSGESATELKAVLSAKAIKEEARAKAEEEGLGDYEEEIIKTMAKRGRQPNISFFAFTATPKHKTMVIFGVEGPDGNPYPFHLYSMRQAIEEHFIEDVLKYYTTYKTYYKLIKAIEDDPEVEKKKAARALARYLSLHPHNIEQKTKIMVEHFRNSVMHKIGGKSKAMLVTSSRLHAVRYRQAFDKYIKEKGYDDIKCLVAFSGEVEEPYTPEKKYTEVGMNGGIKEKELRDKFATDEYQILIVAEKYQTGFNQPLLHTMYVDKRLSGVQAVQTLSRLNRIHPGKEDTFVLDFVNEAEEIFESFQPYYEQTYVGEQAEPRQLYEMQAKLESYNVFYRQEVDEFAKIFYKPPTKQNVNDHAKMNSILDPPKARFEALEEEQQEEIRKVMVAYRNLYSFLTQVMPFQDSDLEKLYSFIRFLLTKIPKSNRGPVYHFDDEIALKYYRLEKTSEGSIALLKGEKVEIPGPISVGTSAAHTEHVHLSKLIDVLNERFGTEFKPGDQLFFDSIKEDAKADSKLKQAALVNTMENFGFLFKKALDELFISRMDTNDDIVAKFMNEKDFRNIVTRELTKEVWHEVREQEKGNLSSA